MKILMIFAALLIVSEAAIVTNLSANRVIDPEKPTMKVTNEILLQVSDMPVVKDMDISTVNHCDLLCSKLDITPVCASNGLCLHEFPNRCVLNAFNCKNPLNTFSDTKDDRCRMYWLTKCNENDIN